MVLARALLRMQQVFNLEEEQLFRIDQNKLGRFIQVGVWCSVAATQYTIGLDAGTTIGSSNGFAITVADWSVANLGEATMPCTKVAIRFTRT